MGLKTLCREPWRGGQICGHQLSETTWTSRALYCGEFKKLGSPLCDEHDREMRADGIEPTMEFAEGNGCGLRIAFCSTSWIARNVHDELVAAEKTRFALEERLGFTLSWETGDPDTPEPATPEEVAAWEAS